MTQSILSRHDNRWGGACWRSPPFAPIQEDERLRLDAGQADGPPTNEPKADIQPTPVGHSRVVGHADVSLHVPPELTRLSLASFQARSRNSAWVIGTWLSFFVGKFFARSLGGSVRGYRQRLRSRLNSGLAQSASRSYPNNDLAGRSISGGSTRRLALTERTRSASTFLGLPLTRNSGKSSQRT